MRLSPRSMTTVLTGTLTFGCLLAACNDRPAPVEPIAAAPGPIAAQRRPTDVTPPSFELPAGLFCDFAFRVDQSGKTKTIVLPGGRTIDIFPGVEWTITNLENGNQETFRIPGSFHNRRLENGNVEVVVTGRNILGDPVEHFLVLVIGRWSFVVDPLGNVVQPLQGTGRRVDICALLT